MTNPFDEFQNRRKKGNHILGQAVPGAHRNVAATRAAQRQVQSIL